MKERKLMLLQLSFMNMAEYAWKCLYKQDSEFASGPKYAQILNMVKFWIWQGFQYVRVTQRSKYARICLDRVLNISSVLIMTGFWIWQNSEYGRVKRVLNMPQCGCICLNRTWICLNMSKFMLLDRILNMYHTIYSARSLYKLISTYWEIGVLRTRSKI